MRAVVNQTTILMYIIVNVLKNYLLFRQLKVFLLNVFQYVVLQLLNVS